MGTGAGSYRARLEARPGRFDLLALLVELERGAPDKPRIGRSEVLAQEIVTLRQDPFLHFPDSNIERVEVRPGAAPEVYARFLGYFGPQGALPLATTAEALYWLTERRDPAFARFADVFAGRFVQMFYRAWAEARPVVWTGRPEDDRFRRWLGSFAGVGTPALADADRVPDQVKLQFAGLLGSRVKSAARLRQILRRMLHLDVDIDERVAMWLELDPADRSSLGGPRAGLGQTLCIGARVQTINDRIRLTVHCTGLEAYRRFLPGGRGARVLGDFLRFYLGDTVEVDIALTLPRVVLPAATLSGGTQLGWTSFIAPAPVVGEDGGQVVCAVFSAAALRRSDLPDPEAAPPVVTAAETGAVEGAAPGAEAGPETAGTFASGKAGAEGQAAQPAPASDAATEADAEAAPGAAPDPPPPMPRATVTSTDDGPPEGGGGSAAPAARTVLAERPAESAEPLATPAPATAAPHSVRPRPLPGKPAVPKPAPPRTVIAGTPPDRPSDPDPAEREPDR